MNINKVILSGELVRKQELRDAGKSQVISFTLVETQGYGDNETKQYHEVEAWGGTAKFVAEHLGKGAQIVIEGRLKIVHMKKMDIQSIAQVLWLKSLML